jgi:hypothetical protein
MKGILNPWAPKEAQVPAVEADGVRSKVVLNEFDLGQEAPFMSVVFRGQTYGLRIQVVRQRTEPEMYALANFVLGEFFAELLKKVPKARAILARQSIFTSPPAAPKVTLELGPVTLYATAGSTSLELAKKMTIDRIVLALLECRVDLPASREILKTFRVDTTMKG